MTARTDIAAEWKINPVLLQLIIFGDKHNK
jgi:hypothetical protein